MKKATDGRTLLDIQIAIDKSLGFKTERPKGTWISYIKCFLGGHDMYLHPKLGNYCQKCGSQKKLKKG